MEEEQTIVVVTVMFYPFCHFFIFTKQHLYCFLLSLQSRNIHIVYNNENSIYLTEIMEL